MCEKNKTFIQKRFKDVKFGKIAVFKNPKHFYGLYLERVNPTHVGVVWGKRRKKGKGDNYIRIAKVYFASLPVVCGLSVAGWLDAFTHYSFNILLSIGVWGCFLGGVVSCVVWGLPFYLSNRRVVIG
jgi:hypothetical protein